MRRLHSRGPESRGIVVDAEGAMLGSDCVLVRRTPTGFGCVNPGEATRIQTAVLAPGYDADWLFEQSRRIALALAGGDIALAQIYGLRIPLRDLDDAALRRLAVIAKLVKAGFDPNEPRIPKGEPGAGRWDYEPGYAKPRTTTEGVPDGGATASGSSSEPGTADPPPDAGDDEAPRIPAERPATAKERNSTIRRTAEWLRQAAALGAAFAPEPRVKAVLLAIEATAWIVEYWPEIRSYLDAPKSLGELQDAVDDPEPGYETHHIIERQYASDNEQSNWSRFGRRLDSRENLVRIPRWRHVEISAWYSRANRDYGGITPREYLRGKSWEEQYEFGLRALRDAGVLR